MSSTNAPGKLRIRDDEQEHVDTFIKDEWPKYDEPLGIHWDVVSVSLRADAGETCVGIARFAIVGGVCELKQILIKHGHAGGGVGTALLVEVERRAREAACHKIRLETADYQARPFYERHGFSCVVTLANDRFHHDLHVMEKRLDERPG